MSKSFDLSNAAAWDVIGDKAVSEVSVYSVMKSRPQTETETSSSETIE